VTSDTDLLYVNELPDFL